MARCIFRMAMLVLGLCVLATVRAEAKVDQAMVGSWFVMTSNGQGAVFLTLDIRPDGTYAFHAEGPGAQPPHSGRIDAAGGHFSMKATSGSYADSGTYMMPYPSMLQFTGSHGMVWWNRKDPNAPGPQMGPSKPEVPAVSVAQVNGQNVPTRLPDYIAALARRVTAWQKDARLVALEIRMLDDGPSTRFYFYSPKSGTALSVVPDAAIGYQITPIADYSHASIAPLPPRFIDLAQAAKVARQYGMGPMNAADLRIFAPDGRAPVLAWQMRDSRRAWYVDGLSGAMLVGDVSGDQAYLEAEWQRAAAGMRSFMSSLNPKARSTADQGGGGPACGFSYPSAGTDYECTNQGGSWSCTEYYGGSCTCSLYRAC